MKVLHTCDVRLCVNPDHLFLGSQAENLQDAMEKGRTGRPSNRGESSNLSKLTAEKVLQIRADSRSHRVICKDHGIDQSTVSDIKRRKSWKYI